MTRPMLAAMTAAALVAMPAAAGNDFAASTSTADGHLTWDADLLNLEQVPQTGRGVYVALLDSGLAPNWRDYFPAARVAIPLGTGFDQSVTFRDGGQPCHLVADVGPLRRTTWVGSTAATHGTYVASAILGYNYRNQFDLAAGYALPPIQVRGAAPEVTLIPVKVLADYQVPAAPQCGAPGGQVTFGTTDMVNAGIEHAISLARAGHRPMVINMSLGGSVLDQSRRAVLDRAIAEGLIVVASAGNRGTDGMGYPAAYPPVISVGSAGWTGEWLRPGGGPTYRMWWLQYPGAPLLPGSGDVADPTAVSEVYVSDFSSRAIAAAGHQLDLLAPGSWLRGPVPGTPGYSHLPWWSHGQGALRGRNVGNYFYWPGTSMAAPHVTAVVALMLQKNPALGQAQIEAILMRTALPLPAASSRQVYDIEQGRFVDIVWDGQCAALGPCDPVGAGLVQADAALAATP